MNVLDDPDIFVYTNQGGSPTVESIDDEEDFSNVREALTLMGTVMYLGEFFMHNYWEF